MNYVAAWGSTRAKRELAESVARFCIRELMPRMRTLEVGILLSRDMAGADGFCLNRNRREFELEIDSRLGYEDFVSCICHEMTHVKQHARGELKDKTLSLKEWKGAEWITLYSTVDEYMALPWEAEAYEQQEILLEKWLTLSPEDRIINT